MAITDINISEQLQTDAPSIKYSGNEGPQNPQQQQQEMMIAKQIWDGMGPEQQGQFQSFEQFFTSGIWKQILQQMQADEAQGQGIAGLGPQPMEQMPNRMGVEDGGRIGFERGTDAALMKKAQFMAEILNISLDEAVEKVIKQSFYSHERPELEPAELRPEFRPNYQEPLRPRGRGMRPPEEFEEVGIESLRGRP